jgi:hypothetical protein
MPNHHIAARLKGIQAILNGVHKAAGSLSSATKGHERAWFINAFLSEVLPNPFRFGTGDATDSEGRKSGQLDVVIEYPFMPTLPLAGPGSSRLYLAEGIAAVVEVKSDVENQWSQALETARQLAPLRRVFGNAVDLSESGTTDRIPLFVAGYTGWKTIQPLHKHLDDADGTVDGILVIDSGLFVSSRVFRSIEWADEWALWGLIVCLHEAATALKFACPDPCDYRN